MRLFSIFTLKTLFLAHILLFLCSWGFFCHQKINLQAIYSLPPELSGLFKKHALYISKHAIDPDKRRYAIPEEAANHYIDLDFYPEMAINELSLLESEAIAIYTEDSLLKHGRLPWNIFKYMHFLENAFREQNESKIIQYATDLGHYIGDAHVPLHTTSNYNGQKTNQHGIHGLWESRIPELKFKDYNLWVGKAQYLPHYEDSIWKCIWESHALVEKVLSNELLATQKVGTDRKYSIESRNGQSIKTYSPLFCSSYNQLLGNMIEQRLRKSILLTASCWYTCWVNAGKLSLEKLNHVQEIKTAESEKVSNTAVQDCIH